MRILCLVWAPFGHRMDELAEIMGGTRVSLAVLYGPRYLAPLRYLVLALRTVFILFAEAPDIVYAQNPPVFCPLVCLLYAKLAGKRLLVDHHSIWSVKTLGRGPMSTLVGWLEALVARSASANTAPHSAWGKKLSAMGAREVIVVHDFVKRNPFKREEKLRKRYAATALIAMASHGGHPLERIEVESEAIGAVPSVTLLICGPGEKLRARVSRALPKNVKYAGFLETEEYLKLKASVDFALNVTDEPHTLSHVLFEYAASSLPVISSRQEVVQEVFGGTLLYSESSEAREVAERVREFTSETVRSLYAKRISEKYEELGGLRDEEVRRLRGVVQRWQTASVL